MATRREVIGGGLAAVSLPAASSSGAAGRERFRLAVAGDYEGLAEKASWADLGSDVDVVFFHEPFASDQETSKALQNFDALALMRERTPLSRRSIERLPRLKLIVFTGPSNSTLDYQAAVDHGITVCNAQAAVVAPGGTATAGGNSPAELALALMLACAWRLPAADALVRRGGWAFHPGTPLRGKVLGIAGYGNLGKPVGAFGRALGMQVLGWSRSLTDEAARADGITRTDLEGLLRQSDVVSIHLPLTAATTGIVGAREIGWMKPGVILINTARAPIVDQAAMIDALRSGKIGMAGLDVFDQEPLRRGHPLLRLNNVVMTPHIGYVTEASLSGMYGATLDVIAAYRQGNIKNRYQGPAERP